MQEDYWIIEGESIDDLQSKVEKAIWEGWKVTGGVTVYHDSTIHFIQAVVKEENK